MSRHMRHSWSCLQSIHAYFHFSFVLPFSFYAPSRTRRGKKEREAKHGGARQRRARQENNEAKDSAPERRNRVLEFARARQRIVVLTLLVPVFPAYAHDMHHLVTSTHSPTLQGALLCAHSSGHSLHTSLVAHLTTFVHPSTHHLDELGQSTCPTIDIQL